ncbi:hypothetical protein VB713_27680 [Anabaena cylindrica UHCC 0172]|uniref:hypothetical protein n=1 Tax=Anabaena cylindrica TaxID=1165 RepID=UPI002B1E97AE|nr:hypothetical protein [Anabaena cylindrica]MEA5554712.1 hypothetical protein [Anabaena cylindrica UHCC 0172]
MPPAHYVNVPLPNLQDERTDKSAIALSHLKKSLMLREQMMFDLIFYPIFVMKILEML